MPHSEAQDSCHGVENASPVDDRTLPGPVQINRWNKKYRHDQTLPDPAFPSTMTGKRRRDSDDTTAQREAKRAKTSSEFHSSEVTRSPPHADVPRITATSTTPPASSSFATATAGIPSIGPDGQAGTERLSRHLRPSSHAGHTSTAEPAAEAAVPGSAFDFCFVHRVGEPLPPSAGPIHRRPTIHSSLDTPPRPSKDNRREPKRLNAVFEGGNTTLADGVGASKPAFGSSEDAAGSTQSSMGNDTPLQSEVELKAVAVNSLAPAPVRLPSQSQAEQQPLRRSARLLSHWATADARQNQPKAPSATSIRGRSGNSKPGSQSEANDKRRVASRGKGKPVALEATWAKAKPPAIVQLKSAAQSRPRRSPNADPKAKAPAAVVDGDPASTAAKQPRRSPRLLARVHID